MYEITFVLINPTALRTPAFPLFFPHLCCRIFENYVEIFSIKYYILFIITFWPISPAPGCFRKLAILIPYQSENHCWSLK